MFHQAGVWGRMILANARSEMQYKLDFLAQILGMMIQYGVGIVLITLVLQRFQAIEGWQFHELAFLYALGVVCGGLSDMVFGRFRDLGWLLTQGEFDRFLLRPVNPFILYIGDKFFPFNLGHTLFSAGILVWASSAAEIQWTVLKVVYLLLVIAGGTLLYGALEVFVGVLAFWFLSTGVLYYTIVVPARDLAMYPVTVFPRTIRFILTFVFPVAFVNFFPAHGILARTGVLFHPILIWAAPLVGVLVFALAYGGWKLGTNKYQGAGS